MGWFRPKEKITKGDYQGVKKADKKKKCEWCGKKLRNNEIYREPDIMTILCKECFDKALDKIISRQRNIGLFVPINEIPENKGYTSKRKSWETGGLSRREIEKKKFNAYLNPGVDEAEFKRSNRENDRESTKSKYSKGRDKVKRILDDNDKE